MENYQAVGHKPFVQEKSSHRPARFAQRVKEELVELTRTLRDPRLAEISFLTITSVEVTPDLKHGTVMFTLLENEEKHARSVEAGLNQAAGFLRRELMYKLDTKVTPQLVFKFDKGFSNSLHIESLLKKISDENV